MHKIIVKQHTEHSPKDYSPDGIISKEQYQTQAVVHLAWKKGVCRGRAAFDITLQHITTFSLNSLRAGLRYICTSILA